MTIMATTPRLALISNYRHRISNRLLWNKTYTTACSRIGSEHGILPNDAVLSHYNYTRPHKVENMSVLNHNLVSNNRTIHLHASQLRTRTCVLSMLRSNTKYCELMTGSKLHTCLHQSRSSQKCFNPMTALYNYEIWNNLVAQQRRSHMQDKKTTSVTVWGSLKEIKSSPTPALALGFGGLIPFIGAPAYMIAIDAFLPSLAVAQLTYGACILSFLGGIRWGMAIPEESYISPDWWNLGYSVVPSLVAWCGLLLPAPANIFVVMGGLAGACYFDMISWAYPAWFKGLRFTLTCVAILSLWTTFIFRYLLKENPSEEKEIKE